MTGIPDGIPVVIGGADQACASLGNGLLDEGTLFIAIGTGGQIVTPLEQPRNTPDLALNTFCHLPENRWYLMGATLAAGLSLKWYRDTFYPGTGFDTLDREAAATPPATGPVFHPYLPGKRSPDLNPAASGIFSGMRLHHTRGHFARAVMEGVALDLRENLEVMLTTGIRPERIIASGGGAGSALWMQILADILQKPVAVSTSTEQACLGAALVAGIGTGVYGDYREAAALVQQPEMVVEPRPGTADAYEVQYRKFLDLYGLHRQH
jgi:xylulokinase